MLVVVACAVALAGCSWPLGRPQSTWTVADAEAFEGYPLYWLGEEFAGYELASVLEPTNGTVGFVYGTCDPVGDDGGCSPPVQVLVTPLCHELAVVTRDPAWKARDVRGAPVARLDGPIVLTDGVQVKVYARSSPLARRALEALRTINHAGAEIGPDDPLPAAPRAVLDGSVPCTPPA